MKNYIPSFENFINEARNSSDGMMILKIRDNALVGNSPIDLVNLTKTSRKKLKDWLKEVTGIQEIVDAYMTNDCAINVSLRINKPEFDDEDFKPFEKAFIQAGFKPTM